MKFSRFATHVAVFSLVFAVLVGGLSAVQSRMNAIRIDDRLTDTEPLENAPPLVAFTTVALGGFRGLVADFLWLRSGRMQDAGNYFEMVQLASWIVKLQPRFTAATAFLAWNMSYNVSVTFNSVEDRWRWVRRGIELIRDEALSYNPSDPTLFHQLGWIYQHKLGKDLDDANRYYKTEMAKEMILVLGDYAHAWDKLVKAPLTPAKLRAELGADSPFWEILAKNGLTFDSLEKQFRQLGDFPEALRETLEQAGVREEVELCLRRRWLQLRYKIDPELVIKLNERYGPLDWRLPEAHAIYWATRGRNEWNEDKDNFKRLSCDRMIFQALNAAFQGGRLVYLKDIKHLEMTPNIDLADAARNAYEEAWNLHGERTIRGAYENFMVDAVVILYKFGRKEKAKEFFLDAKKKFGHRFDGNLDEFVIRELGKDMALASYNQAQGTVQSYLLQSCYALALGELDQASAYELIAKKLYDKYEDFIGKTTKERRGLPPYSQMKRTVIEELAKNYLSPEIYQKLLAALPSGWKERGSIAPEALAPDAGKTAPQDGKRAGTSPN